MDNHEVDSFSLRDSLLVKNETNRLSKNNEGYIFRLTDDITHILTKKRHDSIELTGVGETKKNIADTNVTKITPVNGNYFVAFYFLLRIFCIISSYLYAILGINYGISQLYILETLNIFCPKYTYDEIIEHNRNMNSTTGIGGCWVVADIALDSDKLFKDSFAATLKFSHVDLFLCILFMLFAIILIVIATYHSYNTIVDVVYFYFLSNKMNPRFNNVNVSDDSTSSTKTNYSDEECDKYPACHSIQICISRMIEKYHHIDDWSFRHMYADSKYKIYLFIMDG